ncbi:MAG: 5-oxoprolinase subunit PxpA [Bacteroidota bacterium]
MAKAFTVDLNCDMGESYGAYTIGNDEAVMPFVSSVNIACGFHGGDPSVMKRTVELALKYGLKIGAHPGLPDLQGFGRREMKVSDEEVYDMVLYQIGALASIVQVQGGKLHHVKPHGALYNMAAKDSKLAVAIAQAVKDFDKALVFYGLSGSELIVAGKSVGLTTANEVFADRTYQADGSLTPRSKPNALITNEEEAIEQVMKMVTQGLVTSQDNRHVSISADTICLHGDGEHAVRFAEKIFEKFKLEGIAIK